MNTNIWNNEKIKTKSKAPVTNAKAEWRKRRDMDDLATEKVQSEDKDGYEEGEGQEDAAEDDGPSAESFDQSGGQRQSKTKSKKNQSMQSGTGIRFERNSSSPPSRISWLQQSLDDSTPLRRTFFSHFGSRFIPLQRHRTTSPRPTKNPQLIDETKQTL